MRMKGEKRGGWDTPRGRAFLSLFPLSSSHSHFPFSPGGALGVGGRVPHFGSRRPYGFAENR